MKGRKARILISGSTNEYLILKLPNFNKDCRSFNLISNYCEVGFVWYVFNRCDIKGFNIVFIWHELEMYFTEIYANNSNN